MFRRIGKALGILKAGESKTFCAGPEVNLTVTARTVDQSKETYLRLSCHLRYTLQSELIHSDTGTITDIYHDPEFQISSVDFHSRRSGGTLRLRLHEIKCLQEDGTKLIVDDPKSISALLRVRAGIASPSERGAFESAVANASAMAPSTAGAEAHVLGGIRKNRGPLLSDRLSIPVRIQYQDGLGSETERTISVNQLWGTLHKDRSITLDHVLAFCRERQADRTFLFCRMLSAADASTGEIIDNFPAWIARRAGRLEKVRGVTKDPYD